MPDGSPVPEGAEPQPDGTIKLSSGSVIPAAGVVLPDGTKLTDVTQASDKPPTPLTTMPDGSKPSTQQGGQIIWTQTPGRVQYTFLWPAGMKVPQGSQMPDGSPVPEGAEPQPDGTIMLSSGSVIPIEGVILPDGTQLTDATRPMGNPAARVATMPDGSKPSPQGGWFWQIFSMSGPSQPSFFWPSGVKVPLGSQLADGSPVPDGAEPQPDGSVMFLTGSVIPAEGIVLPDGTKLTDVTKPTGKRPSPAASMPDGSKPSQRGGWFWTVWRVEFQSGSEQGASSTQAGMSELANRLVQRSVEQEAGDSMTLYRRYWLVNDSISEAMQDSSPYSMSALFVWLRMSSARQFNWCACLFPVSPSCLFCCL